MDIDDGLMHETRHQNCEVRILCVEVGYTEGGVFVFHEFMVQGVAQMRHTVILPKDGLRP